MARRGQEGGRVLGLGEQQEAGRGDGGGTDPTARNAQPGWGQWGAAGTLWAARVDRGAQPAEVPGHLVAEGGAYRRERSAWAKVCLRGKGTAPCAICPLLIKMPMFK